MTITDKLDGVKMHDGQQMYHAYLMDAQNGIKLLGSGPKDWVADRAQRWLEAHKPGSEDSVIIARIEECIDAGNFVMSGVTS